MVDFRKIFLFCFLFSPRLLICQEKIFTGENGIVLSAASNVPIEGATVLIRPGGQVTITNEFGKFFFADASRADSIFISAIGFETTAVSFDQFAVSHHIISLKQSDVELSSVTVSANRRDPLNHISEIDIRTRDITNSQEVLRLVPGLFIGQHAGGGKAEQLFLRGFDLDHGTDINITVDGMPVNMVSHAHGQGYADLHFLVPELIENVNFEKGCYNSEKGNLNTAGYVEFKTTSILPANTIKLEAGQFNSYRAVTMVNLLKKETQ